ncbi:Gfa-like protein [Lysobacter capsici AZ78]|uniref:Gfa-like protein n=1 Tax=Lysobacter capsici AZ78 TaxID=1444315 RepID=A0A108UC48_9GAMM|nr:GFA family protein [Lysobacter capsici]KWS06370.1 Gfa-like protein [Lysobacter capsici AZ78]
MHKQSGSCHCGRVTFELQADIREAMECNCSICHREGAIWFGADDASLRILSGESDLSLYQFGTMAAKHYFCGVCGVSTFSRPRIAPNWWVVNLRCIDGIDLSELKIYPFDGRNWESAALQYAQSRKHKAK